MIKKDWSVKFECPPSLSSFITSNYSGNFDITKLGTCITKAEKIEKLVNKKRALAKKALEASLSGEDPEKILDKYSDIDYEIEEVKEGPEEVWTGPMSIANQIPSVWPMAKPSNKVFYSTLTYAGEDINEQGGKKK